MDAAASATIALQKAQATQIYAGLNLWPAAVTARLVQSQLVEDGTYPGTEGIFAEPGTALVSDFDPAQPRDPDGRWTNVGGEARPSVEAAGSVGGSELGERGGGAASIEAGGASNAAASEEANLPKSVPFGKAPDGTPIEAAAFRSGRGKNLARALGAMLGAAARLLRRWLPEEPDDISQLPSSPSPSLSNAPSSPTSSGQAGSNAPSPSAGGGALDPAALSRIRRYGDARNALTALDPANPELAAVALSGYIPSEADIEQIEAAAGAASVKRILDFLRPGGRPIGQRGTSSKIREMSGGLAAAQRDFDYLSVGGTSVPFEKGSMVRLPGDAGTIVLRPNTSTPSSPAIDIDLFGIIARKLHY